MSYIFVSLAIASAVLIWFNFFWNLWPSNRKKIKRPFLWYEWIAFLFMSSMSLVWAQDNPAFYLLAVLGYVASWSSFKDWHRWLDHKEASHSSSDTSE